MNTLRNTAISASAGTGKTYRLTHRYLALLAAGVQPERICALTFSRKAAGEIFDRIIQRLCEAASDPTERKKAEDTITEHEFGGQRPQAVDYTCILRDLVEKLPRLKVGTLDSFIVSIIRMFPFELGIPPDATPIDNGGGEATAMRRAILAALAAPPGNPDSARAVMDAFRQATFGAEKTGINNALDDFAKKTHEFFRSHRSAAWGDARAIWEGAPWWDIPLSIGLSDIPDDLEGRLRDAFGSGTRPEKLTTDCAAFIQKGLAHSRFKAPFEKFPSFISPAKLFDGTFAFETIAYYKKTYSLPPETVSFLFAAVLNIVHVEMERALEKTQGLCDILNRYDAAYSKHQNFDGRYTFGDLTALLGPDGATPSCILSDSRLYIDYRLDSTLDHWLLDEFQDTSDAQWSAIFNLIDEVVQDENRSLFYVGDVKQSIYGWRGGNSEIFDDILKEYGGIGDRSVHKESIADCRRSLPAVIDAVNTVFGNLADWTPSGGRERGLRQDAIDRFNAFWETHTSARQEEGTGFVQVLEYETTKGTSAGDGDGDGESEDAGDPDMYIKIADILKETDPIVRGISTAVLVRSNEQGRACVNTLRKRVPKIPCIHEGVGGIIDNPVVTLLLAIVRRAAHPGDTVADRHIKMSPLRDNPALAPLPILERLQHDGFAKTLRVIAEGLPLDGDNAAFGKQRLAELLSAAEEYDAKGGCDLDEFAEFIESYQVRSGAESGVVRVMTIAQSKGLGFDMVFVPFENSTKHSFANPDNDDMLFAGDGTWVLKSPKSKIVEAEENASGPLWVARERIRAKKNFDQLCSLYVALTRAKDALYLLLPAPPKELKKTGTVYDRDLIRDRLSTDYFKAKVDSRWFERHAPCTSETDNPVSPRESVSVAFESEIKRFEPSKTHAAEFKNNAARLFDKEASDNLVFGTEIHTLFAQVEWIEKADTEGIIAAWRAKSGASHTVRADVERQFRACLANPDIHAVLARPANAARTEVWREAPFSLALEIDGEIQLVGGRFDRLSIERDTDGKAVFATILDYKSNQIKAADAQKTASYYVKQMSAYKKAAAKLLALPESAISTKLVFTRAGSVVE